MKKSNPLTASNQNNMKHQRHFKIKNCHTDKDESQKENDTKKTKQNKTKNSEENAMNR